MAEEELVYVYCIARRMPRAAKGERPRRAPRGLVGASKPRRLEVGDYEIVVADAPGALYSGAAIDAKLRDLDWVSARAAEHEAVVEHVAASATALPMKLFTIFESDDRAVAHVRKMKRALDRAVEKIAGCDEWGVRVLLDEARAPRVAGRAAARARSGTSFLLEKRATEEARRVRATRSAEIVDELFGLLAGASRRALRRAAPTSELSGRVLLDAVFLVPRTRARSFKAAVARKAKGLTEGGCHVRLTGPWPAYSFVGGK